jgi:hypothetical protein
VSILYDRLLVEAKEERRMNWATIWRKSLEHRHYATPPSGREVYLMEFSKGKHD